MFCLLEGESESTVMIDFNVVCLYYRILASCLLCCSGHVYWQWTNFIYSKV